MAQASFRLQAVLNYRRSLLDQARLELALAQARRAEAERLLEELREAELATLSGLGESQNGVVDLPSVMQLTEHLNVLASRVAELAARIVALDDEVDRLQQELFDRNRDVKALEKLSERQTAELALDELRLERADTSETAALRYQRQQASAS